MNTPLFDYYGACEDLREIINRAYRRILANPGTTAAQEAYFLVEDASQLWQEFYALA